MVSAAFAYLACAAVAFLHPGLILDVVRPLLFALLAGVSVLVFRYVNEEREKLEGLRQRDLIRATFGRYLSNEVVEEILNAPDGLGLTGESREVTFLVSDLRGFTALSCALSPQTVVDILNRYLEIMLEIVSRFGGTVSELQGDGLLVYFGAPIARGNEPERAVACALTMQNALAAFNRGQRKRHLPLLGMGIGIETGEVVVGSIGSDMRAKYTAIGSAINTAFRIESITVGGQILIAENTYAKVADIVSVRRQKSAEFKGIEAPMRLYEVDGVGGAMAVNLVETEVDPLRRLVEPVPIQIQMIESKQVAGAPMAASVLAVGRHRLEVQFSERIGSNGSVRIRLGDAGRKIPDAYATVEEVFQEKEKTNLFRGLLRFTWLPEDSRRHLECVCAALDEENSG
jgi:adenylate cyclase